MQGSIHQRIFGLDIMRALAIVLVVFSHVSWILPDKTGYIPQIMAIAGVIGVEIFFVLSGFLIGRIIYRFFVNDRFNVSDVYYFWVRRWFRTLPNYFLALILNVLVVLYIGSNLPDQFWQYVLFIQNFGWEMPSFFYESWSLSIEEFAYLLGPFFAFILFRLWPKGKRSTLFLVMTLTLILVATVCRWIYNSQDEVRTMTHWNMNLKAVVIYRLDAVYYGVLAAYLSIVSPRQWGLLRYITFFLGLLLFFALNTVPLAMQIFIENHPGFWNIWYLPLNSLGIMLTLPLLSHWISEKGIIVRVVTSVSLISYAVYVLHYSIILQLMQYFIPADGLLGLDIIIYILVYVSLVFLCAYILYHFFEKHMTKLRDHPKIIRRFRKNEDDVL